MMERSAPGATCGTGMVAVVRGLNDAALAVTLLDSGKQYTLLPNNMLQAQPVTLDPSTAGVHNKRSAATSIYNDRLKVTGLNRNTSVQATDGRYASIYQTAHCHMKPTSPPTDLTEFPPQRSSICRGHDNFVVGGTGSGDTNYVPVRSNGVYRGAGLVWPDRGSVCSPRPSREPDAFAKSLRRYPCYSPERSTEIVERLISYTKNNNSGKISSASRVSPTRRSDYTPYADQVYRYSRSPQRTYDAAKSRSPQRTFEPDVKIRTKISEESPSSQRSRKFEENDFRRQFKFDREVPRQMRASQYNAEGCTNDRDGIYKTASEQTASDQSVPSLVNTKIQASAEMTCKAASTRQCGSFTKNVAIPGFPSSAAQHAPEGGVLPKSTQYSHHENKFTPDKTNLPPLDIKKSIPTTLSSIELSKTRVNSPEISKKSRSELDFNKEDGHELFEWLKTIFEENPAAKGLYDEVLKKCKCRLDTMKGKKNDIPKNGKTERCPKVLSPHNDRIVNDPNKGKFKSRYTTVYRAEVNSFTTSDDFKTIVGSWFNDIPIRSHDYLGRLVDKEQIIVSFVRRLKEASDASGFDWPKLKSDIVGILNEIPIEIKGHDNKLTYLDRKANALVDRLKRDSCWGLTKLNANNINLNSNDTKSKPFYKKMKDFVRAEMMDCIKKFHLESNAQLISDIEEDLVDILINSIEILRSDENDLVTGVIATLLQDSAALFEHQAMYIATLILDHLKLKLNGIEQTHPSARKSGTRTVMNSSFEQDHALESTDFSIGELSEEDFDANLDVYVQLLAQQIDEWLANLPIVIQGTHDENFRQVVIHDLAVDIVDRHKYLELNPMTRFSEEEELEYLKFQIFKWINKLVDEDSIDTIEHAPQLMERIRRVPVPTLSSLNSLDEIKMTADDQAKLAKNYNKITVNEEKDNQNIGKARIICACDEAVKKGKNEKPMFNTSPENSTVRSYAKIVPSERPKSPANQSCNVQSTNVSVMPIYFPGKPVDKQCSSSRFGNATQRTDNEKFQDIQDRTQMPIFPAVNLGGTMSEMPQVVATSVGYTAPRQNVEENTTTPIKMTAPVERLNKSSFPYVMNRRTTHGSTGLPKIILPGGRLGSPSGFPTSIMNNTSDLNSMPSKYGEGKISRVNETAYNISKVNETQIPSPLENLTAAPAFTEVSTLGPSSLRQNIIFNEPSYVVTGLKQMSNISGPEKSLSIPQTTSFTYSMPEVRHMYEQSGYDILQTSGALLRQQYTKQERNGQPLVRPKENIVIHRTISSTYMVQQMNQAPMSGSGYQAQSYGQSQSYTSQVANSFTSSNVPQDAGAGINQSSPGFQQLSDQYDSFVQDWVQAIPIAAASQEEQEYAKKIRMDLYNGVWRAITKLKSQPHLMFNRFHYEDALDDEIENLFTIVPQSQEFLNRKHLFKINLIEKTSQLNEMIKVAYAPEAFKQQLVDKMGVYVPRLTTEDRDVNPIKLYEDLQKLYLAEDFILYTRYKEEDPVRANAYKNKLLNRIQEFIDELKRNHNAELQNIDRDMYLNEMLSALQQVPLPSDVTVREAADEALLGIEIEQWYNNLPLAHNNDLSEQLKRRRLRDALAKRLHEIEKSIVTTDNTTEGAIRNEISLFLQKVPLERDQSLNINYMVDNLASRVMNREIERSEETRKRRVLFHDTVDYQEFSQHLPISSSLIEIPGSKVTSPGFVSYSQSFRPPVTEPSGAVNFGVMQKVDVKMLPCSDTGAQTEREALRYLQTEQSPSGQQRAIEGIPYQNYPSVLPQSLPPSMPSQSPQQSVGQYPQQTFQSGVSDSDPRQFVAQSAQQPFQDTRPSAVQSPQQTFQSNMPGQDPRQSAVQSPGQPFQSGITSQDPRQSILPSPQQTFQAERPGRDIRQSVIQSPQQPFQGGMTGQDPRQLVLQSPQQTLQSGRPGQDTPQYVLQSPQQTLQSGRPGQDIPQYVVQSPQHVVQSPQQTFQGSTPRQGFQQSVLKSPQQTFQGGMPGQVPRQPIVSSPQQPFQIGMPEQGQRQTMVSPLQKFPFQDPRSLTQSERFSPNNTVQNPGSYSNFSYGRPPGGTWHSVQSDNSNMPHFTIPNITPPQISKTGDQSYGQTRESLGQSLGTVPGQAVGNANQPTQWSSQAADAYQSQSLGRPQLQNSMPQPMNMQSLAGQAGGTFPRQILGGNLAESLGPTTAWTRPDQSAQSPAGWNQPRQNFVGDASSPMTNSAVQSMPGQAAQRQSIGGGNLPRQDMARPGGIMTDSTGQHFTRQEAQTQSPYNNFPRQDFAEATGPTLRNLADMAIDARPKQDQGQNPINLTGPQARNATAGSFPAQSLAGQTPINLGQRQAVAQTPVSGQPGQSVTRATELGRNDLPQSGTTQTLRVPCTDATFQARQGTHACYCPPTIIRTACETFAKPHCPHSTKQCMNSEKMISENIGVSNQKPCPTPYYIYEGNEGMQQADGNYGQPVGYSTPQECPRSSPRICRRPLQAQRPGGSTRRIEVGYTDDESDPTSQTQKKKCRCVERMKKIKKRREACYDNVDMSYREYPPMTYYYPCF